MAETSDEKPIMIFKKDKRMDAKKRKIEALINLVCEKDTASPSKINKTESETEISKEKSLALLKEDLRKFKKASESEPSFYLTQYGLKAQVNFKFCNDDIPSGKTIAPLFVEDVRDLIMKSCLGNSSPYFLRWCKLLQPHKVNKVVFIILEGLSKNSIIQNISSFKNTVEIFPNMVEVVSSNIPFALELTTLHLLTGYQMKVSEIDHHKPFSSLFPMNDEKRQESENKGFSRLQLLLSPVQLVMENYPIPRSIFINSRSDDYCFTKDSYSHVNADSPMFAIDCEMCITESGKYEVTHVAIVDEKLQTVYATLVKPIEKIVNYLTKYSGVTEEILMNVTTSLEDVQKHIQSILPSDAILCGQSLNCDLHALKMIHPYVIDTSVIYNASGNMNVKDSLKKLSLRFLNEIIQDGSDGHNPIEDSIATMKLVQLKLRNSIHFGDAVLGDFSYTSSTGDNLDNKDCTDELRCDSLIKSERPENKSTISEELKINQPLKPEDSKQGLFTNFKQCFFTKLQAAGKKFCIIGSKTTFEHYYSQVYLSDTQKILKSNTKKVFKATRHNLLEYDLTFSNFSADKINSSNLLSQFDMGMKQLYDYLPDGTLFMCFASGVNGDTFEEIKSGLCMVTLKNSNK